MVVNSKVYKIKDIRDNMLKRGLKLKNKTGNTLKRIRDKLTLKGYAIPKKNFKEILFYAVVPGILINYSLWGVFGVGFTYYSFPAYGILLYLIKHEVLNIWTHLWFRAPIKS